MAALGPVARAKQIEPGDVAALVGVGVGLLLDGEPARTEAFRLEPEPPVQVQAATDLADGGFDELESLGVAEPAREPVRDRLGTGPFPQSRRQQRAHTGITGKRVAELSKVLSGEALDERPGDGRLRPYAGRLVDAGCRHGTVLRAQAVGTISGNSPTWAVR
jgi:hypothetical protein